MAKPTVEPDAFNAFEAAGWEEQVAGYEDFFGPITARVAEPLLDATESGPGVRLLEVGCGPGHLAAKAAGRGAAVIGVDGAAGMVSLARRLHPQLDVRRGDAEALAFPDGSFEAVVASFVLLHLGRPEQAAAEFTRVLVPGGRVALTVWDEPDRARFIGVLLEAIAAAGARPPDGLPVGPPFFRFSDDEELAGLLSAQSLDDIRVRTVSFRLSTSSPDTLWRGMLGGTVRVSAVILGQTDPMQRRIRAAFAEIVQPYQVGDHLELPVSVKLASARKPA
jgi:ubiquinone/menaquinone biosynthesis C-methylase UbiE